MAKTILLAAADPNIAYLLQRYAEESGFATVCTHASQAALDVAREARPALIILEMDRPSTTGRQMLARLKAEPQTSDIPIVVYSYSDDASEGLLEGAAGHLNQAVLFDDFLTMLENVGVTPEDVMA